MNQLLIEPLIGIGEIKFGNILPEHNAFLGKTTDVKKADSWQTYYFWDSQLRIGTDPDNKIDFIGIRNHGNLNFNVMLFGLKVFETPAYKMVETIVKSSGYNFLKNDSEIPYSYKFPELG